MFARKQSAFAVPTRQDLNALWLRARKEIGSSVTLYIAQPSLGSHLFVLSVKCYRSSLQPRWQCHLLPTHLDSKKNGVKYGASLESVATDYLDTLISSDLSVISSWLAKCLLSLNQSRQFIGALDRDFNVEWCDNGLEEIDDEKEAVDISCSTLFQAFSAGLATGRLSIENLAHVGNVDWLNGRIIRAYWSKLAGSEALIQMALLNRGRYSFDSGLNIVASDGLKRTGLAISSSMKADNSISLDLVLLDAAFRQEQLNFLQAEPDLNSLALKRRENSFSQARINRKLTQSCGHQNLVYCLELLQFLGQEELSLSELQRRTSLPTCDLLETIALLVRAGFVRLAGLEVGPHRLFAREQRSRFDLEDGLYTDLKNSLQSNIPMSFVLIKSSFGKTSAALREKIASMLKDQDQIFDINDDCLLLVLPCCTAVDAAEFVRRLRVKSNKAIYLKRILGKNCANFAFSSSVVSAPEDGCELQILLSSARQALFVSKRLKASVN